MEAVVDTNILVYEMVEDSMYHDEVCRRLGKLRLIYIPTNVLIEFVLVLRKIGVSDSIIYDKLRELLSRRDVRISPLKAADFMKAVKTLSSGGHSSRYINDKLILALAERRRIPIYTYDKQLEKQAVESGVRTIG